MTEACCLVVTRTQRPLASNVTIAKTWWSKMAGLLGRSHLPANEGLLLPGCRSIHTCGMRFAIDAVFVDRGWQVVALKPNLVPWRLVWPVWKAWGVIELASGSLQHTDVKAGDWLRLIEPTDCGRSA